METGPDLNAIRAIADGANRLIGQSNYNADADIDRDGDVDTTDYTLANAEGTHAGLAQGLISDPAIDNIIGYAGYLFNPESPAGTYTVRHRHYDPTLGRFISRDPIGYADGMGLYEYGRGAPTRYVDPYGLTATFSRHQFRRLRDDAILLEAKRMAASNSNGALTSTELLLVQVWLERSAFLESTDQFDQMMDLTAARHHWMTGFVPGSGVASAVEDFLEDRFSWWSVWDIVTDLPWFYVFKAVKGARAIEGATDGLTDAASRCPTGPSPVRVAQPAIDDVIASASRPRNPQITEGARVLDKKLGHAESGGYTSAFEGIAPTHANAELLIRNIMSKPSRTFYGDKVTDIYNAAGQGIRLETDTGRFIGFLEGSLATQ